MHHWPQRLGQVSRRTCGLEWPRMSLQDLWAAHSSGSKVLEASATSMHRAAGTASAAAPPPKRQRTTLESTPAQRPHSRSRTATKSVPAGETNLGRGSILIYQPRTYKQSQQLFKTLQAEVKWISKSVSIFGKDVMEPRQVAYMADNLSLSYTYSKTKMTPVHWHPEVEYLKARLEDVAGAKFNSCLLNLYRDGKDHMGWHSDNEKLYGDDPVIGSLSFGAPRRFLFRNNDDHSQKWECTLGPGDVLIMKGTTQRHWTHSIPKAMQVSQPRINLTFRQIRHPE